MFVMSVSDDKLTKEELQYLIEELSLFGGRAC